MFIECKGTILFVLLCQFVKTWTNMDEEIGWLVLNTMEEHFCFEKV